MVSQWEAGLGLLASALVCAGANASPTDAREIVANLDTAFQAAVKVNDAPTMRRILHEDMVLVLGNGKTSTGAELIEEARNKLIAYEQQDEDPGTQTVRVWGDTAIVTARLWVKGVRQGGLAFDRRVWFSDTYVRTPQGWRYFFGQVSLRMPDQCRLSKLTAG
jgi:ketosteroid isomerase-like protein